MDKMLNMNSLIRGAVVAACCVALWGCQKNPPAVSTETENKEQALTQQMSDARKTILFFGNSLTAGYGLEPEENFPYIIQTYLDSLELPYKVMNLGVSGETTASGNTRIDWVLQQQVDIFILELGGNDGLRGIDPDQTRANLQSMIDKVKSAKPDAILILAGMQVPPNMGADYAEAFSKIYPDLARENKLPLIPFLLEGVGGEPDLNLPDGIHPNAEGHQIVAENVWNILKLYVQN